MADGTQPVFYYDLGNPRCYIVAEQIMPALPVVPEWEPVMASQIDETGADADRPAIERRATELGLQPMRWPAHWPPDSQIAMLAATYAKHIGRAVAFSLAAFRQAFAGGRDLDDEATVLIAAAACEMHPTAVLKGISLRSVTEALERSTARARSAGITALPAIRVGDETFEGERGIELASRALGGRP